MSFRVVLDACVLLPYHLSNLLLHVADAELYTPLWSDEILDEVHRNLVGDKFGVTAEQAARRLEQMRRAFSLAVVDGYQPLMPAMTNDPKDRHVLAAAVRGGAALIVTANLRDFPPAALDPFDIEAISPDDFLLDQLDLDEQAALACVHVHRQSLRKPNLTAGQYYTALARQVPRFAAAARAVDPDARAKPNPAGADDLPMPAAQVILAPDDARASIASLDEWPDTPFGAIHLWCQALQNLDECLEVATALSVDTRQWGDYRTTAAAIDGWSIAEGTRYAPDSPGLVASVKFVPDMGHSVVAFGDVTPPEVQIVTAIRSHDNIWRVWGVTNYFPTAAEVHTGPPPPDP